MSVLADGTRLGDDRLPNDRFRMFKLPTVSASFVYPHETHLNFSFDRSTPSRKETNQMPLTDSPSSHDGDDMDDYLDEPSGVDDPEDDESDDDSELDEEEDDDEDDDIEDEFDDDDED